ncbi:cysteine dioxygenase family protein [Chromobacterium amazonense]|uniref:Cysteine dioxygenase family protein n=1 Tax=Chromobacterium amazonense TaxID=1382803 RepID=A0ABU8V3P2_9NEIS|nr:cysteine dioxygenase family protein [Chromobacterium amazonense]MDQ4539409.1 cysteine dioxygenase family protein [Chromobacterium amazonense]
METLRLFEHARHPSGLIYWLSRMARLNQKLGLEQIQAFLQNAPLNQEELLPYWKFSGSHYHRNPIYGNEHFELLLFCWHRQQSSSIHNHHGSHCGIMVIQGTATEERYAATAQGQLISTETRDFKTGSILLNQARDIHKISNRQQEDLVTLHLYSPPMRRMDCYNLERETPHYAPQRIQPNMAH